MSAAGLISLALVNQSFTPEMLQSAISTVFQDLSILVGEVERGTLVYVDSPNYALLARATQTIRNLLDRMIVPSHNMARAAGHQAGVLVDSMDVSALDDGGLGLWGTNSFQDFEINFWDNLAGHPFLNH